MEITYLYHSGFAVRIDDAALVFDYYKDTGVEGKGIRDIIAPAEKVYFFVSHSHFDHFNPEIADFKKDLVFLSDEVESQYEEPERAIFVPKGKICTLDELSVTAFGSTDCGASFYVKYKGVSVFHAGDLNNWHWNEQVDENAARASENEFLRELQLIKNNVEPPIDVVIFAVDSRLGKDCGRGAEQFISEIETKVFVPMHAWDDYDGANAFEKTAEKYGAKFFAITKKGDTLKI
ncbi:hydrolase [Clostridia bacterium]|nr:hydrolase [Clostridia bacterium]